MRDAATVRRELRKLHIKQAGLQPYVLEAATLCARGCNPMC